MHSSEELCNPCSTRHVAKAVPQAGQMALLPRHVYRSPTDVVGNSNCGRCCPPPYPHTLVIITVVSQQRMKRYEDIGSFWIERGAGKERADVAKREEQLTLKAARRQAAQRSASE